MERADSNSEQLIKWSKVHSGVRHGGPGHAAGRVERVEALDGFVNLAQGDWRAAGVTRSGSDAVSRLQHSGY